MRERLPVFAITGASGNGKTAVLAQLIRALAARGWRVMTCKDSPSGFVLDRPGTDSSRLADAGAEAVWLQSTDSWAVLGRTSPEVGPAALTPQALAAATASLYAALGCPPPHLILVEGFHAWDVPSAHVLGPRSRPPGPGCVAYVTGPLMPAEEALEGVGTGSRQLPVFRWDDGPGLAALVERTLDLHRPRRGRT